MYQVVGRWLMAIFQTIIFSNCYIALCSVMMCLATIKLFQLQLPNLVLSFLFVGTLGSYSLHEFLTDASLKRTDRERWINDHKLLLLSLFMGCLLAGGWLLTQLRTYLAYLLPVILLTFLYTAPKINWSPFRALRHIAVLKTTYLALVWTYVTVALPILITTIPINWALTSLWFLNRFLFIYCVALCFDYRDRESDRQSRWLTIASMLTERQVRLFFGILTTCFGLTAAGLYSLGWHGWTLLCICLPMILLLVGFRRIINCKSDYIYYGYLDGLLMVSGILLTLFPSEVHGST